MSELEKEVNNSEQEISHGREIVINDKETKEKIKSAKPKKTKNKKDSTRFKWTKELIFLLVGLTVLIVVTIVLSLPTKMDKLLSRWEGSNLSKETVIREISEKDLLSEISKQEGHIFVFYGTPDNEDSVTKINLVEKYAKLYDIDATIYWLDATETFNAEEDVKNSTDFKTTIDKREEALQDVDLLKVPSFWVYVDGIIKTDSADKSDTAFENIVNNELGAFSTLQK